MSNEIHEKAKSQSPELTTVGLKSLFQQMGRFCIYPVDPD